MSSTDFVPSNQTPLNPQPKQQNIIPPQQVVNIAAEEELKEIHQNITEEIQPEKKREEGEPEEEQEKPAPEEEKPISQKTKLRRARDNLRI